MKPHSRSNLPNYYLYFLADGVTRARAFHLKRL